MALEDNGMAVAMGGLGDLGQSKGSLGGAGGVAVTTPTGLDLQDFGGMGMFTA